MAFFNAAFNFSAQVASHVEANPAGGNGRIRSATSVATASVAAEPFKLKGKSKEEFSERLNNLNINHALSTHHINELAGLCGNMKVASKDRFRQFLSMKLEKYIPNIDQTEKDRWANDLDELLESNTPAQRNRAQSADGAATAAAANVNHKSPEPHPHSVHAGAAAAKKPANKPPVPPAPRHSIVVRALHALTPAVDAAASAAAPAVSAAPVAPTPPVPPPSIFAAVAVVNTPSVPEAPPLMVAQPAAIQAPAVQHPPAAPHVSAVTPPTPKDLLDATLRAGLQLRLRALSKGEDQDDVDGADSP